MTSKRSEVPNQKICEPKWKDVSLDQPGRRGQAKTFLKQERCRDVRQYHEADCLGKKEKNTARGGNLGRDSAKRKDLKLMGIVRKLESPLAQKGSEGE